MSKALKAMLAALVALLLLGACGDDDTDDEDVSSEIDAGDDDETPSGDDDETSSTEDEGSSDDEAADSEFVQQAEAFCTETNEEGDAAFRELAAQHPEFEEVDSFSDLPQDVQDDVVELITDVFDGLVENLRSIEPEGQEDEWSALLDDFEDAVGQFEDDPAAAFESDPFAEVNDQLVDFGLAGCGG